MHGSRGEEPESSGFRTHRHRLRVALEAPVVVVRRTARDPVMVRVQLGWAAVMTASWAVTVALTVTAYDAGGSSAVGLAVLARAVAGVLVGPVVGVVVDRVGRRRSLLLSALVCAAASAVAAAATAVLVAVVLLLTIVEVATMVFRAAQSVVLPELVDEPADLTAANVLSSAIEALGVFVGPALAGLLIGLRGPELTLGVAAAFFAGGGLLVLGLRSGDGPRSSVTPGDRPPGLRQLLALDDARLLLGLVVCQTLVAGALVVLYAALAVEVLDADLGSVGLLTSVFGLGGVVGSLGLFALAGSPRLGALSAAALALWAVPLMIVPATPQLGVVLGLLMLVGIGNALFDVTVVTLLQRAVPEQLLGRAFGALETAVVVGLGAGAALAPAVEHLTGPAVTLALAGGALAVVAGASVQPLRRLDSRLAAPTRQVALLRSVEPFALLPTLALERLALRLREVHVPAGEVVVRQGEPGNTYFLVEHGVLTVSVDGRTVTELDAGDGFGEVALLRGGTRTATVAATTPVTLQALEGADFLSALTGGGGLGLAAADEVAAERLRRAAPGDTSPASPDRSDDD